MILLDRGRWQVLLHPIPRLHHWGAGYFPSRDRLGVFWVYVWPVEVLRFSSRRSYPAADLPARVGGWLAVLSAIKRAVGW